MKAPHRSEPAREVLPVDVSERLLARAAELDAALKGGTEVVKLRAAAIEAGISPGAFDAALHEMHETAAAPVEQPSRRRPRIAVFVLGLSTLLLAGTIVSRSVVAPNAATIEQAFLLRCLPVKEAIQLIPQTLEDASTVSLYSPASAPRVLRVRALPQQMGAVRAQLERLDAAACEVPASPR